MKKGRGSAAPIIVILLIIVVAYVLITSSKTESEEEDLAGEAYEGAADCPAVYTPVCGSDGITYANDCFAEIEGARVVCRGRCPCRGR